jgi:phytoene dehydrogenase-like protein
MTTALIIGGGTNGLACAFRLAQAGHRVTVLEAADAPGATAALAHLAPAPDARLAAAMDLTRHGLAWAARDIATTVLSDDGAHRRVQGNRTDGPDAAAWAALHQRLTIFATALAPFRQMTPPRLKGPNEWGKLAKLALGLRRMGKTDFREFLRVILTNAADVAEDELSDPLLRGLLSFDATLGAFAGPRSPNTLILYLNRLTLGPLGYPRGGPAAVSAAMARAAQAAGVTIRTAARVARIVTADHRAGGVTLTTGETLTADVIVSAIGPRSTFRNLIAPGALDAGFRTRAGQIRARGTTAKLALTLRGLPDFRGADLASRLVIAPSVDAVENAWNPAKYNEVPARPVMEVTLPTVFDPAGGSRHTLSALIQSAPPSPADPEAARAALLANALAVLEDHAPGLKALVEQADLLLPGDIADQYGLDGGQWHQAELSVEQMLFLRPTPEAAHYATPLPGLWLAGAGSHPGGWITGTPGWNAAEAILKGGA